VVDVSLNKKIVLGVKSGLDPERILEVIGSGAGT